jgi:hypothetical protein
VRPNYYCGQLLTDADLRAMVDWSRSRFALSRYRDGWGVVCGLEVTCHETGRGHCGSSEHRGTTVYVNPGYAIDCCGNDLVVCEPCAVDLSRVCSPEDDPCADPRKVRKVEAAAAGTADGRAAEGPYAKCFPPGDLFAVNLTLRYGERMSHGQRTIFQGECTDLAGCEYGRIEEKPCVQVEPVGLDDCTDDLFEREVNEYQKRLADTFKEELAKLEESGKDPALLARYLRRHPPHSLCFIVEYVCCLLEEDRVRPTWWNTVMTWLWADRMLHLLRCGCGSCSDDRGVPIARVVLQRKTVDGKYRCKVLMIDERPPSRRPIARECRPGRIGDVDLVPFLWQPLWIAESGLWEKGIILPAAGTADATVNQFMTNAIWSASRGSQLRVHTLDDVFGCKRVVGFSPMIEP